MQAEFVPYELYERAGLPPTWLPRSCISWGSGGDGAYGKPGGTLYSDVLSVTIGADATSKEVQVALDLSHEVHDSRADSPGCAGLGPGVDSEYIKTVQIVSPSLSAFWKRNVSLEACVLLPGGFAQHPDARYPTVVSHGHFSPSMPASGGGPWHPAAPACDPDAPVSATNPKTGYACVQDIYGHLLYRNWTDLSSDGVFAGARMLLVTLNHPTPFFDDSYAVDSASTGPYGHAINYELIPEVERRYRGLGQGWARGLYGGSTGGWESVATQVLYPDRFNGAYAACPDPITFTSYVTTNIYEADNAFYYNSDFRTTPRPGQRDHYSGQTWPGFGHPYGQTTVTAAETNHRELVLGSHSRSCGQWDVWEQVFSPVCDDGFPCRLYDKKTGALNRTVAAHWREHYDLGHIMKRDWATLGPKLQGKMHIFVGGSDTFFLSNAVMDVQDFLQTTTDPASDAEIVLGTHGGRGYEHCFRGFDAARNPDGSPQPNSLSRLTYNQAFLPRMAAHFAKTAPKGADVTSWRY